ncbi:MAG TPA: S41 family peptidase [Bryobacteraceae bacterium]|jgi:carboxyl-terminal processing protease|nr:S41 family peptidase [Bryobacteraceae bacterium]
MSARCLSLLLAGAVTAFGQTSQVDLDSFEKVWTTVRDKHWQARPGGLDWQAIHDEYRPRVEKAASHDAARAVIQEMIGRLKQSHFAIIPAPVYSVLDEDGEGPGVTGIDARVLNGQAVVVSVDPGSPAEKQGVRPGWQIERAGGKDIKPIIDQARSNPAIHELQLTRALQARLSGSIGGTVEAAFLDGPGKLVDLKLNLTVPRGALSAFGNLPAQHVWFESRKIATTAYVRFNLFLDLPRVMAGFQQAVESCKPCDGLIIDLRGNPGGIGGMAMGMAGYLVDKPNQRLGTMYMRDSTLNFVVNPRADVLSAPVAVLVDGCSASTSEIFAGGLKDLGRARVFGTRTAAAALPSAFERLPNGDGFQYAVANYVSQGGQPLEGLGVTPDVTVELTRPALLAGHDAVLDAALDWIRRQKKP